MGGEKRGMVSYDAPLLHYLNEELKHHPSLGTAITMFNWKTQNEETSESISAVPYHPGLSSINTYVRPDI